MRVFYNRNFRGHYPTGTAAVVVAPDAITAAELLALELAHNQALGQAVPVWDMVELEMKPQVVVLQNGDY